jgi:hypothetical protein
MKIKSIIDRPEGHFVDLDGTVYEFNPPSHVCEVEDKHHLARFLSIPEGYELFIEGGNSAKKVAQKQPESPAVILLGSDVHPSAFEIHGTEYSLGSIVQRAFAASEMNHEAWNELSEGERADLIDAELDQLQQAGPVVDPEAERAALVEQYVAKFDKKPHHKLSNEKIRAELEA